MTCCECGEEVTELPDINADWSTTMRLIHVDSRGRFLASDHEAVEGPCKKRGWWRKKAA